MSQVGKYPAGANETIEERAARIQSTVENIVAKVGDHPEYELKRQWLRDKPPLKAEFIRDVLSIVNSDMILMSTQRDEGGQRSRREDSRRAAQARH